MKTAIIIDGNAIVISSIDAVTPIVYTTTGVYEGTDKVSNGSFEIMIKGNRIKVFRGKRFPSNDDQACVAALRLVRTQLEELRTEVLRYL